MKFEHAGSSFRIRLSVAASEYLYQEILLHDGYPLVLLGSLQPKLRVLFA